MFIKGLASSKKAIIHRNKARRAAARKYRKKLAATDRKLALEYQKWRQSPTCYLECEISDIEHSLRQLTSYKTGKPASRANIQEMLAQYQEFHYHSYYPRSSLGMMAHAEVAKLRLVDAILVVYGKQLDTWQKFNQVYPFLQIQSTSDLLDIEDIKNLIRLQVEHYLYLAKHNLARLVKAA